MRQQSENQLCYDERKVQADANDERPPEILRRMNVPAPMLVGMVVFTVLVARVAHFFSKIRPVIDSAIPRIFCQDAASLKKKMPATAISAAPPASTIGTADKGPPF